jgi:hypothetical protein
MDDDITDEFGGDEPKRITKDGKVDRRGAIPPKRPKWKRQLGSAKSHDTAKARGTNNKKGY